MMMILPLRYTHIGRYFRVVAEYTLNSPTRGLKHRTTSHLTMGRGPTPHLLTLDPLLTKPTRHLLLRT